MPRSAKAPKPADAPPPEPLDSAALVPVRARTDGWTPGAQRAFIEALSETACVTAAAQAAGKTPQSAWRLRRRPDAQAFAAAWAAALECGFDRLVSVALDRAINGTVRERYYRGQVVGEERIYHNGLLMKLIKSGAAMLGHDRARSALSQDWDRGMAALEAGARDARDLLPDRYDVWHNGAFLVTNCPPGADFTGFQIGLPGEPTYWRQMTTEESEAHAFKAGKGEEAQEQDRADFFALDDFDDRFDDDDDIDDLDEVDDLDNLDDIDDLPGPFAPRPRKRR